MSGKQKSIQSLEERQKMNKVIWKDTYKIAEQFPYKPAKKITNIDEQELEKLLSTNDLKKSKVIMVFNEDLITTIDSVIKANFKPLILLNANDNYPLESVKHGLISPECDLYRCSNITMAINDSLYPIRDLDMIYCSKITIFKTLNNKTLPKAYQVSLVLSSPVRRPTLISIKTDHGMENAYSNTSEETKMKNKIENIFKLAILKGYNCLLLTDFGCQIENNPIEKVIEFFNEAIKKYPIKYVFFSVKMSEDLFENKKSRDKNFELFHLNIKRS